MCPGRGSHGLPALPSYSARVRTSSTVTSPSRRASSSSATSLTTTARRRAPARPTAAPPMRSATTRAAPAVRRRASRARGSPTARTRCPRTGSGRRPAARASPLAHSTRRAATRSSRGPARRRTAARAGAPGRSRRARDALHLVTIGAGEPRDQRRVRGERELVALRDLAVVHRHREVLVDHPSALVEPEADDLTFECECDGHGAQSLRQLARKTPVRFTVAVEQRVSDADPALARVHLGRLEPRDELGDRAADRRLVVGLHVRRRARLALRALGHALLERVERRRHRKRVLDEAETAPDSDRVAVRGQHLEADVLGAALLRIRDTRSKQRLRRALPPRTRAHVDELHVRPAAHRRLDPRYTGRAFLGLGDEHTAAMDVVERVLPLVRPRLALPVWVGHLTLELLPELTQDRLVGFGRAADVHGVRAPVSR